MITSTVTVCALPGPIWAAKNVWGNQTLAFHSFVQDALGIELRIEKGVNQENERSRLSLCCSRLEAAMKLAPLQSIKEPAEFKAALTSNSSPVTTLGQNYLDAMRLMYEKATVASREMRLGATFFPPDLVPAHVKAFAGLVSNLHLSQVADLKTRIEFFRLAAENQCGVVELQNPFTYREQTFQPSVALGEPNKPAFQIAMVEERSFDNEGGNAYEILYDQVDRAVQSAKEGKRCAVNFSNQPHNVITEVLNAFAYSDSGNLETPIYIQVIYTDGSQARDLPLKCLPTRAADDLARLTNAPSLKVALLSMRHLEMDHRVDLSWFRNREVSKARAFAETDEFCYAETKRQLQGMRDKGAFIIHLYQTGLQPAIVGFYRALVEELVSRAEALSILQVVPFYYRGKSGYEEGKSWD